MTDCISKDDLNHAIHKYFYNLMTEHDSDEMDEVDRLLLSINKDISKAIKELPSVIPKGVTVTDFADKCRECGRLKKGKWTIKAHGFPPEPYTACSNCDYDIDFEISKLVKADAFTIEPYRPNYCPNCGSKMEVKE